MADGWAAPLMNYMPPAAAAEAQTIIDRAAREVGRDPSEIRRIYNMSGAFTATPPAPADDTDEAIIGPPEHWAEVLTHFALDLGLGTFLLIAPPDRDTLRTFIEDVAPQVRERVATARARGLPSLASAADQFSERTAWVRRFETPLRDFLRTEAGGAAVLLAAAVSALVWANLDASSYEELWETECRSRSGMRAIRLSLREWVNSGLMTFFFFVVGLEARREFDVGELRERRRLALPLLAAIGGMGAAIAIYLAFNLGARPRRAGGSRCRPTPLWRSACSRSPAGAFPSACGRSS